MSRLVAAGAVLFLVAAAFVAGGAVAPAYVSHYADGAYGFSFQPPAFAPSDRGSVMPVMLSGSPENGFSSNVNVMIQNGATTRAAYRKQTLDGMNALGLKVVSDKDLTVSGKDATLMHLEGAQQGRNLQYLLLSVIDAGRVYVVTCTATKEAYPAMEAKFQASLDSFALAR